MKLYEKKYESPVAWGVTTEHNVQDYIRVLYFFPFTFAIMTTNKGFTGNNPFKVLMRFIESKGIQAAKYDALKGRIRYLSLWKKL